MGGARWMGANGIQEFLIVENGLKGHEAELEHSFTSHWPTMEKLRFTYMGKVQRDNFKPNEELGKLFEEVDLLITPCLGIEAFGAHGPSKKPIEGKEVDDPLPLVGFLYPFNFSGHPVAVIRTGFSANGLPLGFQIAADRHRDDLLLQVAHAYEQIARPFDSWPS